MMVNTVKNAVVTVKDGFRRVCVGLYGRMRKMKEDTRGMGTIEMVLLVAVLVALALLFKAFITKYANTIFDAIDEKTEAALENW